LGHSRYESGNGVMVISMEIIWKEHDGKGARAGLGEFIKQVRATSVGTFENDSYSKGTYKWPDKFEGISVLPVSHLKKLISKWVLIPSRSNTTSQSRHTVRFSRALSVVFSELKPHSLDYSMAC
jgi:hypothetical protein